MNLEISLTTINKTISGKCIRQMQPSLIKPSSNSSVKHFSTICYPNNTIFATKLNLVGRILAIDYGKKRIGIAVTDPMQMIATRLTTVLSPEIWTFLKDYFAKENVEKVIVGYPMQMNNQPSEAVKYINPFLKKFQKDYPDMPLEQVDERFTSKMAFQTMIDAGLKKKDRQNKETIDGVSATIILQSYLEQKKFI